MKCKPPPGWLSSEERGHTRRHTLSSLVPYRGSLTVRFFRKLQVRSGRVDRSNECQVGKVIVRHNPNVLVLCAINEQDFHVTHRPRDMSCRDNEIPFHQESAADADTPVSNDRHRRRHLFQHTILRKPSPTPDSQHRHQQSQKPDAFKGGESTGSLLHSQNVHESVESPLNRQHFSF